VACLGSGYDFKAEMALGEDSSGLSYDLLILHYWKDYVQRHRRVLVKGGIDLTAVKRARSLPVSAAATSESLSHRSLFLLPLTWHNMLAESGG
jgi:hypothetical protein